MEPQIIPIHKGSPSAGCQLEVVIPLWNEESLVRQLHARVAAACRRTGLNWRAIYVDDGSTDRTAALLRELVVEGEPVQLIRLSRNFGQSAAILAGLRESSAGAVILMDGDLQDPPELIPQLVTKWKAGAEVVIARRRQRKDNGLIRSLLIRGFHRLFSRVSDLTIPANCGTYSLMDARVVEAIRDLPEADRFFPGLRAWAGYRQAFVDHDRPERLGSAPRQSFARLMRYAADAIYGYSRKPVGWMYVSAWSTSLFSVAASVTGTCLWLSGGSLAGAVAGMVAGLMGGLLAMQMLATAWLAGMLCRVMEQSRQRPLYLVAERAGGDRAAADDVAQRAA